MKFPCATRQHRLFCRITQNWRGTPLHQPSCVVVELIASDHDQNRPDSPLRTRRELYPKGVKVCDEEMEALNITRDPSIPNGTTQSHQETNREAIVVGRRLIS